MSTLPRDSTSVADAAHRLPLISAVHYEQKLDAAVLKFETVAAELGITRPSVAELHELCQQAAAISAELFSGEMVIGVRGDPEIPGELHFTFGIAITGGVEEIVKQSNQWHVKLRETIGRHAELFCLSFDVR